MVSSAGRMTVTATPAGRAGRIVARTWPVLIFAILLGPGCKDDGGVCGKLTSDLSLSGLGCASAHTYAVTTDAYGRPISFAFDCGQYTGSVNNVAYSGNTVVGYTVLFYKPSNLPDCVYGTPAPDITPPPVSVRCVHTTGGSWDLSGTAADAGVSGCYCGQDVGATEGQTDCAMFPSYPFSCCWLQFINTSSAVGYWSCQCSADPGDCSNQTLKYVSSCPGGLDGGT